MRPRIAFATLLAFGAAVHLALLVKPPPVLGYWAFYLFWLLPSAAVAWFISAGSSAPDPLSARQRGKRRAASSGLWMEGLGLFVGIATVGLVIHLLGPWLPHSTSDRSLTRPGVTGLMAVLCAAGCWGLLRGAPGDKTAPIPDGSRLVRAGSWLRRLAGIGLSCWGAWLLVAGIQNWGSSDGISRMMNLMFVVGGPLFFLLGLALALRRGRSAA